MKRIAIPVTILILIASAGWTALTFQKEKNIQAGWHTEQMKRGQALWSLIHKYKENNGEMPRALTDMVDVGQIEPNELEALQFQESPKAQFRSWGYMPNPSSNEGRILLFAPVWIYPWEGHSGSWVVIGDAGQAETISKSNAKLFPILTQNTEQQAGGSRDDQ